MTGSGGLFQGDFDVLSFSRLSWVFHISNEPVSGNPQGRLPYLQVESEENEVI
jgi:hypothetical protein